MTPIKRLLLTCCGVVAMSSMAVPALAAPLPKLPQLMSARGVRSLPAAAPAKIIHYGEDDAQKIELFLPRAQNKRLPLVVLLAGDCWSGGDDSLKLMRPAAAALVNRGYAVWSVGYRGMASDEGGYPDSFADVTTAIDLIAENAEEHELDPARIALFGHGGGAHLALWAAGRRNLPAESELRGDDPTRFRGVLAVSGFASLQSSQAQIAAACGVAMLDQLSAGTKSADDDDADHPTARDFSAISPERLLPTRIPSVILHGIYDPVAYPAIGLDYATAARRVGDAADLQVAPMAGHYEAIAPGTAAFSQAMAAIDRFLR